MARHDGWLYWGIGISGFLALVSYGKKGKTAPVPTKGPPVILIHYMTDTAGRVVVSKTPDGPWSLPRLDPNLDDKFRNMVSHWRELVTEASLDYRVPESWIYGVMWSESKGDPTARSPAGAIGLMQVMPFHFKDGESPFDPRTNIRKGVSLLQLAKAKSPDLIRAASFYNAGGNNGSPWTNDAWLAAGRKVSQTTRWGYAAEPSYLDTVAAANNTFLALQPGDNNA